MLMLFLKFKLIFDRLWAHFSAAYVMTAVVCYLLYMVS